MNEKISEDVVGQEKSEEQAEGTASDAGPLGLDIGTTNIVVAENNGKKIKATKELNAFFSIPYSNLIKRTLVKDGVSFCNKDGNLYIIGSCAEEFATMYGADTRRPVESGLLNPKEEECIEVIKAIMDTVIRKPHQRGETICFSVPGEPLDRSTSIVFHESVIRMHLQSMGFSPLSVNEGLAVVLSELAGTNFTGIGISIGGGMCNICFSYLSVPVITYSIQKGGDYIDTMVASAVGLPATKVKLLKEEELDLSGKPKNKIETALHIYYDELFSILLQSLERVMGTSDKMPRISKDIPIVLSGGSVIPKGCREKFGKAVRDIDLPIKVSDIRIAEKPLYATAKGSLKMAMEEVGA